MVQRPMWPGDGGVAGGKGDFDRLEFQTGGGFFSPTSDGITGRLLSAQWDHWTTLATHATELAASDVYTLRRIVPGERGKNW